MLKAMLCPLRGHPLVKRGAYTVGNGYAAQRMSCACGEVSGLQVNGSLGTRFHRDTPEKKVTLYDVNPHSLTRREEKIAFIEEVREWVAPLGLDAEVYGDSIAIFRTMHDILAKWPITSWEKLRDMGREEFLVELEQYFQSKKHQTRQEIEKAEERVEVLDLVLKRLQNTLGS